MGPDPTQSVFLTELDAMIVRAEAACEKLRIAALEPGLTERRARTIELNKRKASETLDRLGLARKNQLARYAASPATGS